MYAEDVAQLQDDDPSATHIERILIVITTAGIGAILNLSTIHMMSKAKSSIFTRLISIHQSFTLYINLAHLIWIPIKTLLYTKRRRFFVLDTAISTIIFFIYDCTVMTVFLLTLSRFLSVVFPKVASNLERYGIVFFCLIMFFGVLNSIIFPFPCSRPYMDIEDMTFKAYHPGISDPLCIYFEIISLLVLGMTAICMPVLLDLLTVYILYKKTEAAKLRNTEVYNNKIILVGLGTCFGIHFLHLINFIFIVVTMVVPSATRYNFYLTTLTWTLQNVVESILFITFSYTIILVNKRFVQQFVASELF